ncbi:PIG-L deacetylase family protein [Nocardia camponoti]|uniref:GlcNAc-PI de-N-acetylase n=1 Tax=Nocardia camponoti TaxID=1616106 RepID=A0A917Q7F6_9NOCA|nr:PIG-L family deacetylase [Nocardia camponoti]GGK33576.1 GlcNAc-PI de-N-acetylase [Nocardia camponoti]
MISLFPTRPREVALLGAHCDDIAIGMGATLLSLLRAVPDLRVRALVLSGGGTPREAEERAALAAFCAGSDLEVTILDVPDGRSPAHWDRIKDALKDFRASCEPDVVFAPQRGDAHQDHRLLAELVPTEFRDHLTLGYEILKWETDTPRPTVYHPLDKSLLTAKSALLHEHYVSQVGRDWFDEAAFLGLARVRGVQCHAAYAETFTLEKAIINWE